MELVSILAFAVAGIFPFLVVLRWQGWGFALSVMFGWGLVFADSLLPYPQDRTEAVFAGIWTMLGWAYLVVWCVLCAAVLAMVRNLLTVTKRRNDFS